MGEEKIVLSREQLRQIARYELSFDKLVPLPERYEDIRDFVELPEAYSYTLKDLYAAVMNLLEENPAVEDYINYWYYPITQIPESFGLAEACGAVDGMHPNRIRDLPVEPEDIFASVWSDLDEFWLDSEEWERVADCPLFRELRARMELFFAERDRPIAERSFTIEQKTDFIAGFEYDQRVKQAGELELALCRRFTEELCAQGSETALRVKGYACYGGNRLYACDWKASRDCMLRLYEMTDNAQYANTLGYIYYYGRCTEGKPEYEKAFAMYSVAAANGLYEGLYKLADMYLHGYGCKKSPKTARRLYGMVYEDSRGKFIAGEDNSFADASLRMGNVFLKGIDEEEDAGTAYSYYLQADYAQRRRSEHNEFFGHVTVTNAIRRALEETRAKLGPDYFRDFIEMREPQPLYRLLEGNNRVSVFAEPQENGELKLTLRRVPVRAGREVEPVLLSMPELDQCGLFTELTLYAVNGRSDLDSEEIGPTVIDCAEWNFAKQRTELYSQDIPVGRISCDCFRLYAPEKPKPSGRKLRLVSIRFQPGGRTYDYLCDDERVVPGSSVIVPGYSGDTVVEVVEVFERSESELALPIDRYKTARAVNG